MNKITLILITILFSLNASAQSEVDTQDNQSVLPFERSGWHFSGGFKNFDSEVSFNEGIDDSSFYLNFGFEGQKESFSYSLGISGLLLSDDNDFSQRVVDSFGNTSTASSSADAFGFYGELGYNYYFSEDTKAIELMVGAETVNASRGIANCSNCFSEDIDLDSGLYFKPRLRFINDSGMTFSIDYYHYLSGDIENGISLNFSWAQ